MREKSFNPALTLSFDCVGPENFLAAQFGGRPEPETSDHETPALITLTWLNDGSEMHFEPILDEQILTNSNENPSGTGKFAGFEPELPPKPFKSHYYSNNPDINDSIFLIEDSLNDERRLFIVLLFYMEKFMSLELIENHIDEIENAVPVRNIDKLKQAAQNCRNECVNSGISEALSALYLLSHINQYSDLKIAGSLINQVKAAHRNFKTQFTEKLKEISEKRQTVLQAKAFAINS